MIFIMFAEAFSQLSYDVSLIVPPRSEPPAGFKCLKGSNQDAISFIIFCSAE